VRFADLLGLALSALRQQKVRTALTTLGVVFGSLVLVASLSVRQGVNETVLREWGRFGELRRIEVRPDMRVVEEKRPAEKVEVRGAMSEARRERLRRQISERRDRERQQPPPRSVARVRLDQDCLRAIAAIDHVRSAAALLTQEGLVALDGRAASAFTLAAPADDEAFRKRLIAGEYLPATGDDAVVVTEYLLYLLGRTDEADMAKAVGGKLRLEYRTAPEPRGGLLRLFPRPRAGDIVKEFTICGVLRTADEAERRRPWGWLHDYADVLLPAAAAQELFFRMPGARENGFSYVSGTRGSRRSRRSSSPTG
jgi:putative ABC transport system permease protein